MSITSYKVLLIFILLSGISAGITANPHFEIPKPTRCYVVVKTGDTVWGKYNTRRSCPTEYREGYVMMDEQKFDSPSAFGNLEGHYFKFRNTAKGVPKHVKAYSAYGTLITKGKINVYESYYSKYVMNKTGGTRENPIRSYDEQKVTELLVEKDNSKSFKPLTVTNLKQMMRENSACMKILNKYEKGKKRKMPFLIGGVALAWAGVITAVVGYLVHEKKLETDPDAKFPVAIPIGIGTAMLGGGALVLGVVKYKKNEDLLMQAVNLYNKE